MLFKHKFMSSKKHFFSSLNTRRTGHGNVDSYLIFFCITLFVIFCCQCTNIRLPHSTITVLQATIIFSLYSQRYSLSAVWINWLCHERPHVSVVYSFNTEFQYFGVFWIKVLFIIIIFCSWNNFHDAVGFFDNQFSLRYWEMRNNFFPWLGYLEPF